MSSKLTRLVVIGALPLLLLLACGGSESETSSLSSTTQIATEWLTYRNSTFGLTFQYPQHLQLLLDKPDTSGIQLQGEGLAVVVIVNPFFQESIADYANQLEQIGFKQRHSERISKGSWDGLKLEGRSESNGLEIEQAVYVIKSENSLLSLFALWSEGPPDYQLIGKIWQSLQLSLDGFQISETLFDTSSFTSLASPDGKFSIDYPGRWQATFFSDSVLHITDLDDRDAFVFSVLFRERNEMSLDDAVQSFFDILTAFEGVSVESRLPSPVPGAEEAVQIKGSLTFQDGEPGTFVAIVATSPSDIYIVDAIFRTSKIGTLMESFEQMLSSFRLNNPS